MGTRDWNPGVSQDLSVYVRKVSFFFFLIRLPIFGKGKGIFQPHFGFGLDMLTRHGSLSSH